MVILCSYEMAKAYADDLRRKLLQAHDRKQGSLRVLAERFGVSAGWAWKISAMRRRTGAMERAQQRHGPVSRVTPAIEARLRALVRGQPDVTLAELQQRIQQSTGVELRRSWLWVWLQRLGLRHKKNRFARKNKKRGRTSGGGRGGGSS